ncbi:MAG: transcriptional activator RfaH [Caulobacteraceae bacterium]
MASDRRWYLVRTLAGREISAEAQLRNQQYETFLPKQIKTVRHARKLRTVTAAYFPCYLFTALDLSRDRWRPINGTFGVSHVITGGERPAPVPVGVVEGLMASADNHGVLVPKISFEVGQRVRLVAGPFADHLAVIDRLPDSGRVRVLLEIMGGEIGLETSYEQMVAL